MEIPTTFGERVRFFRKRRGMTQRELAALVARSHSMISAIENDTRHLHIDELARFADVLKVTPTALLGQAVGDRFAEGYEAGYTAALNALAGIVAKMKA